MYKKENPLGFGILLIIIILIFVYGVTRIPTDFYKQPSSIAMIEFMLSLTIMVFAIVEGFSTYLQVVDNRNNRKFIDVQNQLEKCYAPLVTILSKDATFVTALKLKEEEGYVYPLKADEKQKIDRIFETYRHIIPFGALLEWNLICQLKTTEDGGVLVNRVF